MLLANCLSYYYLISKLTFVIVSNFDGRVDLAAAKRAFRFVVHALPASEEIGGIEGHFTHSLLLSLSPFTHLSLSLSISHSLSVLFSL